MKAEQLIEGGINPFTAERLAWVCNQRAAGLSLAAIGDEMGLTKERIRQMELKAESILDRRNQWYYGLGTRSINTLVSRGYTSRDQVINALRSGELQLWKLRSVGKKTIAEIESWLLRYFISQHQS